MIMLPKSTKACGSPVIVELLLTTRAAPLAMFSIPRVTMKEGIFHCSHTKPLIAPQAAPVPMQPSSASGMDAAAGRS